MKGKEFLTLKLNWAQTGDPIKPYRTEAHGHSLTVRLNDFPAEPHYTLMIDGEEALDFDDWPAEWSRPRRGGFS